MFHLQPDKLPWQHSWMCAYASPDETGICSWWKNSQTHQYWESQANIGRVSDLNHPMTVADISSPLPSCLEWKKKKKGVLLSSVALKASFCSGIKSEGNSFFLDYRAGTVFWCSTCSCLIKLHLKVLSPQTPFDLEQPSLCQAVIYDHCATLIPWSALVYKTCFFFYFFSLFL